jgi:hypothetical protein
MRDAGLDEGVKCVGRGTENGSNGGRQQGRITEHGKIDEDRAIGKLLGDVVGYGERQASLSNATRSGECEQRGGLVEQGCSRGGNLTIPPYERGPW